MVNFLKRIRKHLKHWWNWPAKEKILFLEALLILYFIKSLLFILPLKFCLYRLKWDRGNPKNQVISQILEIKTAVSRANRMVLWKNVCLVQSLTARLMLSKRAISSEIFIGVKHQSSGKFVSHAWLISNNIEVVEKNDDFLALFKV